MDFSFYLVFTVLIGCFAPTHTRESSPDELTCPSGWLLNGELCYRALYNKLDLSWMDANYECEKEGGRLAEPTTPEISEFLFDIAKTNQEFTGINHWFIGITDMGSEGNWVKTSDCTSPEEFLWGNNAPSNKTINSLDCGVMILESAGYHWNDISCTTDAGNKTAPICEIPRINLPPECPDNWEMFENHCYYKSSTTESWETAKQECVSAGANLASIHSSEENNFIKALGGSVTKWIGGLKTSSVWGWIDGSEWEYENWAAGEPSGSPTTLAMNGGGEWTNLGSNYYSYVCKL